jgi:hypothetical protein
MIETMQKVPLTASAAHCDLLAAMRIVAHVQLYNSYELKMIIFEKPFSAKSQSDDDKLYILRRMLSYVVLYSPSDDMGTQEVCNELRGFINPPITTADPMRLRELAREAFETGIIPEVEYLSATQCMHFLEKAFVTIEYFSYNSPKAALNAVCKDSDLKLRYVIEQYPHQNDERLHVSFYHKSLKFKIWNSNDNMLESNETDHPAKQEHLHCAGTINSTSGGLGLCDCIKSVMHIIHSGESQTWHKPLQPLCISGEGIRVALNSDLLKTEAGVIELVLMLRAALMRDNGYIEVGFSDTPALVLN